ncbi:unnamed protein product [Prorocentrum cordatum]|uniref:Uncharacterized protein n=2 Tax=Prorocentrum cordatum TaxID=2364126 RepID=A0ABN9X497_9DINO|nr:unnamed protein product [Polarella glacialis]
MLDGSGEARMFSWEWQWVDLPDDTSGSSRAGLLLLTAALACQCLKRLTCSGHVVVVPNRECDIYTRLWCVYEIFVARERTGVPVALGHTFASAGRCSSREATCGKPVQPGDPPNADTVRITKEILDAGGDKEHDRIDRAVFLTTRAMYFSAAFWALWFTALVGTFCAAEWHLRAPEIGAGAVVGDLLACAVCGCTVVSRALFACTRAQGRLAPKAVAVAVLPLFLGACALTFASFVARVALTDEGKIRESFGYTLFASFCGNGASFLMAGCAIGFMGIAAAAVAHSLPNALVGFAIRRPAAFCLLTSTPLVLLHVIVFRTRMSQLRDLYAALVFHTAGVIGYFFISVGLSWWILVHEWGVRADLSY